MSPLPRNIPFVSVEDYLAGELHSEVRHEYIDGQVYAMGGASRVHGQIANALAFALTPAARKKSCQLFAADMKVCLTIAGKPVFYYPDLLAVCDPADREPYFIARACLIIEVLSESTERIDRREKFLSYQTLPGLQACWLVAQDACRVEVLRHQNDWQPEYFTAGEVEVDCLDTSITVDMIYQDIQG